MPLDALDDVDWNRLTHAYGSAEDLPASIRDLTSEDPGTRKDAVAKLHATICHQGSRYPASAPAVPFLLELLRAPDTGDKQRLIELLVGLAVGYAEWHVPLGFRPDEWFTQAEALVDSSEPDALMASLPADEGEWDEVQLSVWKVLAYRAVLAGIDVLRAHVTHADEAVRLAAVKALAWFPHAAGESSSIVRGVLHDGVSVQEFANAVLCLGLLGRYQKDTSDLARFSERLDSGQPWLIRVAAAISLGVLLGPESPPAATSVLLEAIERAEETTDAAEEIAWHWLGLLAHSCQVLERMRPPATDVVLARLCAASERVEDPMAGAEVFSVLLSVAFPDIERDPPPRDTRTGFRRLDPTQLTGEQLRALRAIGRAPVWDVQPFVYGQLMDVGLQYGFSWDPKRFREMLHAAEQPDRERASPGALAGEEGD